MATDLGIVLSVDGEKETRAALKNLQQEGKRLAAEMKAVTASFTDEDEAVAKAAKQLPLFGQQIENQIDVIHVLNGKLEKQESELEKLRQELVDATDAERKAKDAVEDAKDAWWDESISVEEAEKAHKNATAALTKAKVAYLNQATAVSKTKQEIAQANETVEKLAQGQKEAQDTVDGLGESFKNTGEGALTLGTLIKGNLISGAIIGGIKSLASAAVGLARAFASAVANVGRFVIETGTNFGKSLSKTLAISTSAQERQNDLEAQAVTLSKKYGLAVADVAEGYQYMALAGWQADEMLEGYEAALALSIAGSYDLKTATDDLTDNLTAFGKSSDYANQMADIMAFAMSNSNTNAQQLGEAYKNVAGSATMFGESIEDATAVLMVMADQGEKGSEAGTHLNSILTRIATNKNARKALEQYVDIYDAQTGTYRGMATILGDLVPLWAKMSDEERNTLAASVAGTRSVDAFSKVMNGMIASTDDGAKSFKAYRDELVALGLDAETAGDLVQGQAGKMMDNFAGDMSKVQSLFESLSLGVFQYLDPALRAGAQIVINFLAELDDAFQTGDFSHVGESLAEDWDKFKEAVKPIYEELMPKVSEAIGKVAKVIKNFVSDHEEEIRAGAQSVVEFAVGVLNDNSLLIGETLATIFRAAFGAATRAMFGMSAEEMGAAQFGDDFGMTIEEMASPGLTAAGENLGQNTVDGFKENIAISAQPAGWEVAAGISSGITDGSGEVDSSMNDIANGIGEIESGMVDNAFVSGQDYVQSFADGIQSNIGVAIKAGLELAKQMDDINGFSVPKKGPLSDFDKSGGDFVDLFAKGVEARTWRAVQAVTGMASAVHGAMMGSRTTTINLGGVTFNGYTEAQGNALVANLNRQLGRLY